jgi:uncharacterized repeat protein (TIGR01451 family)
MKNWKNFSRVIFLLALLLGLTAGVSLPAVSNQSVSAAPMQTVSHGDVVISEFRFLGPASADDEFIELYNPKNTSVDLTGLKIMGSNNAGSTSNRLTLGSVTLLPGQHYLLVNSNASAGLLAIKDATYSTGITADGGIAITLNDGTTVIDAVGLSSGSLYYEGTPLKSLSIATDSYERKDGGALDSCVDTNDNSNDFQETTSSNPQNLLTPARLCGGNADLGLTQSVDNSTPAVSSNVTFTITVKNNGTGDARYIQVKDDLPYGLTYVPASSSATLGSYSVTTGIWTVGTLTNGSDATLTLVAKVAIGGQKVNEAGIWSSYDQDPISTNNNASVKVTPLSSGLADLSITKKVNNASPNVGDSVVFMVSVSNTGTDDPATNVLVKDKLPAGMSYVSHTSGETYNPTTGIWIVGDVPIGTPQVLRITAKVNTTGEKINWAEVWSADQSPTGIDRNYGNSSYLTAPITDPPTHEPDEAYTKVTPGGGNANLSLTQDVPNAKTGIAGYVLLKITVTNNGPHNATNVVVKDDLPTGLTYVSDNSGGSYNKDSGLWSAGALAIGATESKSLSITAKVDLTGVLLNEAEVWSADQAPTDSRVYGDGAGLDYASRLVQSADLSITESMDNVIPTVGTDVVFTITVRNDGPNDASVTDATTHITTGPVVKDLLTANYKYLSDNAANGDTYVATTGMWTLASPLSKGQSKTLKITATVLSTTASTFINWAEVFASDQVDIDSVPGDSSQSSDDDASAPSVDLRIDQTVDKNYPGINSNVTFTVTVTNDGTVGATGVQVKDKLPSGLAFQSYSSTVPIVGSSTVGTYVSSTGIWIVGTLDNGASATLTLKAQLTASGVRTNWAEVWRSDLPDPDSKPGNSSTTEDDDASTSVSFRPILINEVAWAGTSASADDQWIELYNPSSVAVNITGWTLKSSTKNGSGSVSIILSGSIASGGYFLLERNNNYTVSDVPANQIYTGALSISGETLTLRDTANNTIDTANQEGFNNSTNPWPKGGGTNHASMERQGNTAENDSVWVANTGVIRNGLDAYGSIIYGTPGKKNSTGVAPTPTPVIIPPTAIPIVRPIINEFLPRPGFDWNQDGKVDVFDEFIEIKNIGITDVHLSGWQLDDEENSGSDPFALPNITLKPGERAVYYGLQTNILLGDGGDTVRLLNPSGKVYDAYTYAIAQFEDRSICRLPDGNGSWYEDCIPTPNFTNSRGGQIPSMPGGETSVSSVCDLPDTLPADFLFAECHGYGRGIWHSFYWDQFGSLGDQPIPENMGKWQSFVQ